MAAVWRFWESRGHLREGLAWAAALAGGRVLSLEQAIAEALGEGKVTFQGHVTHR